VATNLLQHTELRFKFKKKTSLNIIRMTSCQDYQNCAQSNILLNKRQNNKKNKGN
jgi:hypothetical protein